MRRIELAVVLALGMVLAPMTVGAEPAEKIHRTNYARMLSASPM